MSEAENITEVIIERMEDFEKLAQAVLKKAIKISMKLASPNTTNYFKSLYALTLRKPEKLSGIQMAKHLVELLNKMESISEVMP